MADTGSRWRAGGWMAVGFVALTLVGIPLFRLLQVGTEQFAGARPGWGTAAWNTLWTGLVVTVLALVGGVMAALITERSATSGRRWLRIGLLLPLLVPPFVSALSWVRAFGPGGLTDWLWGFTFPRLFGPLGVVVVVATHVMPLAYLVTAAGLAARAEPDLDRAARVSGAGPVTTLVTVTLPLLAPALVGAAALVFVATVNSFGIPAILGSRSGFFTVTTRIYQDLAFSADLAAFRRAVLLASGLVVVALLVVGSADLYTGRRTSVVRTSAPVGADLPGGRRVGEAVALWLYLVATIGFPLLALVLASLTRAVGLAPTPANLTLANFGEAMSGRFLSALGRSLLLALVAATVVVVLGALLVTLRRTPLGRRLGTVALLTFAVPGSTLAVAMLIAYGRWLRDTLLIILFAYLAKFWALGHRTLGGSADRLPPDLYRAARTSGANRLTALRTVVVPLMWPALTAAWVMVFLFGLHELTMSSLLHGPGTDTLAVVILNLQQLGDVTVTSALAVLITVPVVVGAVLLLAGRTPALRVMGFE